MIKPEADPNPLTELGSFNMRDPKFLLKSLKISNQFKEKMLASGKITSLLAIKPEADPNPLTEPKWLV